MGFKAWRNLGALALAGASLVGCASTPPQNTKVVAQPPSPPPQNNSWNTSQPNQPPPPNKDVFGAQQSTPSMNGGLNAQPRPNTPGFPQSNVPTNPNTGFNPSTGPQSSNFLAPGVQGPSNPPNAQYFTTPNAGLPQAGSAQNMFANPGGQPPAGSNFATTPPAHPNTIPPLGGAPASVPLLPDNPPPAQPGSFTPPLPAPPGFPTSR
jgi:hypothetical protein